MKDLWEQFEKKDYVDALKAKNRGAWDELTVATSLDVEEIVKNRATRDKSIVVESVNYAFGQAFAKIDTYEADKGTLRNWIATIAVNEAKGRMKKQSTQRSREISDTMVEHSRVKAPGAGSSVASDIELIDAINTLEPDDQFIIWAITHGFSGEEVASKLGRSVAAVQQQISRARRRLWDIFHSP